MRMKFQTAVIYYSDAYRDSFTGLKIKLYPTLGLVDLANDSRFIEMCRYHGIQECFVSGEAIIEFDQGLVVINGTRMRLKHCNERESAVDLDGWHTGHIPEKALRASWPSRIKNVLKRDALVFRGAGVGEKTLRVGVNDRIELDLINSL